jgi:hypothetical protein
VEVNRGSNDYGLEMPPDPTEQSVMRSGSRVWAKTRSVTSYSEFWVATQLR